MSVRNYGNVPLFSTTAASQSNPSTATLVAELIIPSPGSTKVPSQYEVRYLVGASTGAVWRLECALSSGLGSTAIRIADNDSSSALQQSIVFTGSNQTSEFVLTYKAYPGDRFRVLPVSSFTGTAAATIEAEAIS